MPGRRRFLQTDPSLYASGLNLYAYVGDDPTNYVDHDGQNRVAAALGAGCVLGIAGVSYKESTDDIVGFDPENIPMGCIQGIMTVMVAAQVPLDVVGLIIAGAGALTLEYMWDMYYESEHRGHVKEDGTIVGSTVYIGAPWSTFEWSGWLPVQVYAVWDEEYVVQPDGSIWYFPPEVVTEGGTITGGRSPTINANPPLYSNPNRGSVCRRMPRCQRGS